MSKFYICCFSAVLPILLGSNYCFGQSYGQATEEMLNAKRVTDFIVLKPDLSNKRMTYQLDNDEESRKFKTAVNKLCVAVVERGEPKQVRLELAYINPFKYQVIITDTTLTDPGYESITKFLNEVEGLSGQLMTNNGLSDTDLATISKAPVDAAKNQKAVLERIQAAKPTKKGSYNIKFDQSEKSAFQYDLVSEDPNPFEQITAPSLMAWAYQAQIFPDDIWLARRGGDARAQLVLDKLVDASQAYYQADNDSSNFLKRVAAIITVISKAASYEALQRAHEQYSEELQELAKFNKKNAKLLEAFMAEQRRGLPGEILNSRTKPRMFAMFSHNVFENFEKDAQAIQRKREGIIDALTQLEVELDKIKSEANNKNTSYRIGTVFLTDEQMHDFTVSIQPRTITFGPDGLDIQEGGTIIKSDMRVRANTTLIPEFATGVFYTNIEYPRFGTTIDANGITRIAAASPTNYRAVVAAHLNLVVNAWQGLVHPMVQLGVGSGKDAPSLMAGGGLRFTKPKRLALTGGAIWTWKRQLDSRNVGEIINGTADLESDLKLKLSSSPDFYLGIQFNF